MHSYSSDGSEVGPLSNPQLVCVGLYRESTSEGLRGQVHVRCVRDRERASVLRGLTADGNNKVLQSCDWIVYVECIEQERIRVCR